LDHRGRHFSLSHVLLFKKYGQISNSVATESHQNVTSRDRLSKILKKSGNDIVCSVQCRLLGLLMKRKKLKHYQ
jgi:hypothetical protein